jgi:predicted nucleotidyltransferase
LDRAFSSFAATEEVEPQLAVEHAIELFEHCAPVLPAARRADVRSASVAWVTPSELIDEAARRLASAATPPAQVVLFGSHARGDADADSDVDLLVIEPEVRDWMAESVRLRRVLRGLPAAFDVVVVARDYAEAWKDVYGTVVHSALTEGRVIHG